MRPAAFMDRDGTLIEEVGYLTEIAQINIFPAAFEAVRRLNELGILAVVVTNQSAIARGLLSRRELAEIHHRIAASFLAEKARLDAFYFCPHHPTKGHGSLTKECPCRKPNPGLLELAAHQLNIDLPNSVMIGDSLGDLEAGKRAGCAAVLVTTGYGEDTINKLRQSKLTRERPDYVASDILGAVKWAVERLHDQTSNRDR